MTCSTPVRRALATVTLAAVCALPACSSGDTDEAAAAAPPPSPSPSAGSPAPEETPTAGTGSPSAPEETAEPTEEPAPEEDAEEEEEPEATDPPRPGSADVVLSSAYWDPAEAALLADGYVGSVVEEGGTCTLEVSREGSFVRATAEGLADATTTVCGGLALPGDELGPGTWSVVLRYESDGASGESAPLEVEVPE